MVRGAWLCGRCGFIAVILLGVDAFDPQRTNRAGQRGRFCGNGCGSGFAFPYPDQRRNGGWVYARHRNSFTTDELWWLFSFVHVPGAGDRNEYSDAPLRELEFFYRASVREQKHFEIDVTS